MAKSKQPELEYIFINPNNEEQTEKLLIDFLVKANMKKVQEALLKEGLITQAGIDAGVY